MNPKKLAVLSALALTLLLGVMIFGGLTIHAAGPWFVNSTTGNDANDCLSPATACKTIQAAIGKASPTETINVAAGTYNEHVLIDKTLNLKGAQSGVDARTRVPTAESIINSACSPVEIIANKVVLDGFTVQGSIMSDPCLIAGIWSNPGEFASDVGGHQILNNIVQNNVSGIELDSKCDFPTLVQFNLIQNNNNPGPGSGNGIQTNFGLCNATIDSNKFSGDTNSSVLVVVASSGLAVSNNELVAGTPEGIAFLFVSNSTITGNKSAGSTSSGTIDLFGGNSNIAVNGNILRNGQRGLLVEDPFSVGPNTGVTAHTNCFVGNAAAGLEASHGGHTGTLDAKSNWWGSASGPMIGTNPGGTGDKIIDPDVVVVYSPFLTSDASTPCAPPPVGPPTNKDQCKNGGWQTFNVPRKFKNQGDCIQFVNTGK